MSFSVQQVVDRVGDYVGNYSTGQSTTAQKIRGVDFSVNYLKNMLGFPQDETKYEFLYFSSNFFYSAPTDYQEALGLYYDIAGNNFPQEGARWDYRPYQELLVKQGQWPGVPNAWSMTNINGSNQMMLLGTNRMPGQLIESFDNNVWTASGDASAAATDHNVYIQGSGSESFTLTYGTGTATLTSNVVYWNFYPLILNLGYFGLEVYFPSTNVTNVKVIFQSSPGNSYTMTATTNSDGDAWQLNAWNKLYFPTSGATITGSPVLTNINQIKIQFTIPSNFGSVPLFRVDDLYTVFPDTMDLIYTTNSKGTNAAGATISILTALTDTIKYDYDFIEPIALQSAMYIMPQLRTDPAFMQMYNQQFVQMVKLWARRWPKKRTASNFFRTRLGR